MKNNTILATGGSLALADDGSLIFLPELWRYVGNDTEITAAEGKLLEIGGAGTIVCTGKPVFISERSHVAPVDRGMN